MADLSLTTKLKMTDKIARSGIGGLDNGRPDSDGPDMGGPD